MSTRHNVPKNRTPGGYRRRLQARGLSSAPRMTHYPFSGQPTSGEKAPKSASARPQRKGKR